jgi:predicted methyltransferase
VSSTDAPDRGVLHGSPRVTQDLDVCFATDAGNLEALAAVPERYDVGGFHILVAAIDDLIAMKRASGRPKDVADIAELEVIRARRGRSDVDPRRSRSW